MYPWVQIAEILLLQFRVTRDFDLQLVTSDLIFNSRFLFSSQLVTLNSQQGSTFIDNIGYDIFRYKVLLF